MSHVLLNLLNELGTSYKMRGLSSILSLFCNEFNKFNNTRAYLLYDSKTSPHRQRSHIFQFTQKGYNVWFSLLITWGLIWHIIYFMGSTTAQWSACSF